MGSFLTPQLKAALLRGLAVALSAFALAFLLALSQGLSVEQALSLGAAAAVGALGIRGPVEGAYDSRRAKTGDVKPSDVRAIGPKQP